MRGLMDEVEDRLLPPQRLAVAYAPQAVRAVFLLLLEFDARLAALVAGASEPLIGQLKLAWWRDAIAMEPGKRPKGEPLLQRLALLEGQGLGVAMVQLVDAWELLLVGDGSTDTLASFAKLRGVSVFGTYAGWVDSDADVVSLGEEWALAGLTVGTTPGQNDLRRFKNRKLRPLTILALSVRDVSGPRLVWHALTGR